MQVLFADKILPNLSGNICCGNSLIGYEIMDIMGDELAQDEDIRRKINPFDFQAAFGCLAGMWFNDMATVCRLILNLGRQ